MPAVDQTIGESGVQLGAVLVPGQTQSSVTFASFGHLLFLGEGEVGMGLVLVTHQIPDLHAVLGGHTDPLEFGVEEDLVDFAVGVDGTDGFLEVGHVPEVEDFVLAAGGQVFGVGGDGHGVDLAVVGFEGVADLEVGVPDLESSVPADSGEVGFEGRLGLSLQLGRVSDLADPVLMVIRFTGVFAVSEGVPELDFLVGTGGDDLTVVGGERHGVDFLLVASELTDGLSVLHVPETEGLVPRGRDAVVAIQGETDVRHEVVVASELFSGGTNDVLDGFGEHVPGHEGFVTRSGNEEGGVLTVDGASGGLQAGDPIVVASQMTEVLKVLILLNVFHN